MPANFEIEQDFIADQNKAMSDWLAEDLDYLGNKLRRRNVAAEDLIGKAQSLKVALPSWGVGTGGTRFARFPGPGEPRSVFEKLEDCAVIHSLTGATPRVSLHLPWDRTDDFAALREKAGGLGLGFDAVNSNTFQDQANQKLSYKFGSITHTDSAVRRQAIEHNIDCIRIGQ